MGTVSRSPKVQSDLLTEEGLGARHPRFDRIVLATCSGPSRCPGTV